MMILIIIKKVHGQSLFLSIKGVLNKVENSSIHHNNFIIISNVSFLGDMDFIKPHYSIFQCSRIYSYRETIIANGAVLMSILMPASILFTLISIWICPHKNSAGFYLYIIEPLGIFHTIRTFTSILSVGCFVAGSLFRKKSAEVYY